MKKVYGFLASAAVAAVVLGQPALASATRSASALPLAGMAAEGGAPGEYCGKYGNSENVKLDGAGNPILDAQGNLINCGRAGAVRSGLGKGAIIVGAGLLGIITIIATEGGGGDSDSPG